MTDTATKPERTPTPLWRLNEWRKSELAGDPGYVAGNKQFSDDVIHALDQLDRDRALIAQLVSALERTEHNFKLAVAGKPVRDMSENLAENVTALAAAAEHERVKP